MGINTSSEVTPVANLHLQDEWFYVMENKNGLHVDGFFIKMMKMKLGLSTFFSIQSVVFNMLLLAFLLRHKDFRSWKFFPVIMQGFIDICGPGIANVVYEWKLMEKYDAIAKYFASDGYRGSPYVPIMEFEIFHRIGGLLGCVLLELRTFLNEYSTGFCLTATAFVRYMLVCQPSLKLTPNHHKVLAAGLITITSISMTLGVVEVRYNNYYSADTETE